MNLELQTVVVLFVVAGAAAYLARVAWQAAVRRKASSCGGCGTCPAGSSKEPLEVVSIESLVPPKGAATSVNGDRSIS